MFRVSASSTPPVSAQCGNCASFRPALERVAKELDGECASRRCIWTSSHSQACGAYVSMCKHCFKPWKQHLRDKRCLFNPGTFYEKIR